MFEAQVPVNEKFKRKALTPPVSLRTFFLVKPKPDDTSTVNSSITDRAQQKECHKESSQLPLETKDSGKPKAVQMKLMDSFAAASTAMKKIQSPSDKGQSVGKRKRKFQEEHTSTHTSLTKLFKQASDVRQTECPVCGVHIEDVSNSGINLHIDKCLEKSSTPPVHSS